MTNCSEQGLPQKTIEINLDFRLLEVSMELSTLEEHLKLIEDQIELGRKKAQSVMETEIQKLESGDQAEWDIPMQEYYYYVNIVLPRVLRNPFLVSLFAVYESAVTEIANLIQSRMGIEASMDCSRGTLLECFKKHYKHTLQFQLSLDNDRWRRLVLLSDLRNAIAHANGRLDMVHASTRERILKAAGVRKELDYLVVEGAFLKETFIFVKEDLEGLVRRYKEWVAASNA